jgi:taurine dioxygenase
LPREEEMDQAIQDYAVTLLSSHTGVEVRGIDLRRPVDKAIKKHLNRVFVDRSVLVIRDQNLSATEFLQAMQLFGDIFPQHNPRFQVPECPMIHYISNQDRFEDGTVYIPGEGYHTDHSNDANPPKATALHAVKLPKSGGDTQFINMSEAYAALPEKTKRHLDGLKARHVYQSKHSARKLMSLPEEKRKDVVESVIHPLVRTHPENGRKALYINPIRIEEIVGMEDSGALPLLEELLAHSTQLKFEYRHKWKSGDVVIWDNRCLMHKANGDYPVDQVRYLFRLMLKSETPT